jgi:hypothetical protein
MHPREIRSDPERDDVEATCRTEQARSSIITNITDWTVACSLIVIG